jgi:sugar phosphate isomerase/epimerase
VLCLRVEATRAAQGPPCQELSPSVARPLHQECHDHHPHPAVQNHGDFIDTGEKHLSLLKRVNHDWCRAMVDTGQYRSADPYADIATMAPYAVNWQIKETLGNTMESPHIDMKKLVTIIRKSRYRGYLPIETLAMKRPSYDPFVEAPKLLAELRQAMQDTTSVAATPRVQAAR